MLSALQVVSQLFRGYSFNVNKNFVKFKGFLKFTFSQYLLYMPVFFNF